jgi:spore coat-associated protein N
MEGFMKRFKVLFGQRRFQALVTIAAVLLAASVVAASGANFTSTSANPSNTFTAGNLHHTNSKDGAAILTVSKMKPGDTQSGTVTITNDGDLAGMFTLAKTITANVPGVNGGDLGAVLDLTITDGATTVWTGKLGAAMAPLSLGAWAAGVTHTYTFTVEFPDGGTPASNTSGDNAYKGSSVTAQFDWTAVQ